MPNPPPPDPEEIKKIQQRMLDSLGISASDLHGSSSPPTPKPLDQVEQLWRAWSGAAIPAQAPLPQRAAMKTAYMAGAASLLHLVLHAEEQSKIEGLVEEMVAYGQLLGLSSQPDLPAGNVIRLPKVTKRRK